MDFYLSIIFAHSYKHQNNQHYQKHYINHFNQPLTSNINHESPPLTINGPIPKGQKRHKKGTPPGCSGPSAPPSCSGRCTTPGWIPWIPWNTVVETLEHGDLRWELSREKYMEKIWKNEVMGKTSGSWKHEFFLHAGKVRYFGRVTPFREQITNESQTMECSPPRDDRRWFPNMMRIEPEKNGLL